MLVSVPIHIRVPIPVPIPIRVLVPFPVPVPIPVPVPLPVLVHVPIPMPVPGHVPSSVPRVPLAATPVNFSPVPTLGTRCRARQDAALGTLQLGAGDAWGRAVGARGGRSGPVVGTR